MRNTRLIFDLCNEFNEINEFCRSDREPIFITKNDASDIVMSYERQQAQLELYAKLAEVEAEIASSAEGADFFEFANKLRIEVQGASDLY